MSNKIQAQAHNSYVQNRFAPINHPQTSKTQRFTDNNKGLNSPTEKSIQNRKSTQETEFKYYLQKNKDFKKVEDTINDIFSANENNEFNLMNNKIYSLAQMLATSKYDECLNNEEITKQIIKLENMLDEMGAKSQNIVEFCQIMISKIKILLLQGDREKCLAAVVKYVCNLTRKYNNDIYNLQTRNLTNYKVYQANDKIRKICIQIEQNPNANLRSLLLKDWYHLYSTSLTNPTLDICSMKLVRAQREIESSLNLLIGSRELVLNDRHKAEDLTKPTNNIHINMETMITLINLGRLSDAEKFFNNLDNSKNIYRNYSKDDIFYISLMNQLIDIKFNMHIIKKRTVYAEKYESKYNQIVCMLKQNIENMPLLDNLIADKDKVREIKQKTIHETLFCIYKSFINTFNGKEKNNKMIDDFKKVVELAAELFPENSKIHISEEDKLILLSDISNPLEKCMFNEYKKVKQEEICQYIEQFYSANQ